MLKPNHNRLGRCLQFGIEIGNDVLERRNRLLDGRNLHQLPTANRAIAILKRNDQVSPLLLKLNQR
ncbi:MAG TPA: hypothetical protein VJS63_04730 [Bradyrhizobium sp.]|nr:hypothetical protein [Bradyrhizobium sp.]